MKNANSDNAPQLATSNQQQAPDNRHLLVTESPRDAMQGLTDIIPTDKKVSYINKLLVAGFDYLDIGSFVSAKAVPQMADTKEVLRKIDLNNSLSKVMVLVVNKKGAEEALCFDEASVLSYPFSVSETFLQLNLRTNLQHAFDTARLINEMSLKKDKSFLCYLSMGLGNPYGDKWHPDIVLSWIEKCRKEGIYHFSISDITAEADAARISHLYNEVYKEFPDLNIGIHLHTEKKDTEEKLKAAWEAGVRQFDSVLGGLGGCPMSGYELLGNLNTLDLIDFCEMNEIPHRLNKDELQKITLS